MAITTRSQWYFGQFISETNFAIDIEESGNPIAASLNPGDYSLTNFATEIARALNNSGALNTYTVTVDRDTRAYTISADGPFDILPITGPRAGLSGWQVIGFDADQTGASSYTGGGSGSVYRPQFLLQDYVPSENDQGSQEASVNDSASGNTEVVSFGSVKFMSCNIRYITEQPMGYKAPIENNQNAVSEARDFLLYLTQKRIVEFMPDRETPATFESMILESTRQSSQGTRFQLQERFANNLPNYYDTGLLRFRIVEE
jgi:hypothetical protein